MMKSDKISWIDGSESLCVDTSVSWTSCIEEWVTVSLDKMSHENVLFCLPSIANNDRRNGVCIEESTCRCFCLIRCCMMKRVDNSSTMVSLRECVLSLCPRDDKYHGSIGLNPLCWYFRFLTLDYFIQQVGVDKFVYVVSRKSLLLFTLDRNKARVSRLPPVYQLRDETPRQIQ
jgi:hypothetical protein